MLLKFRGLNTLGISPARVDYAPYGGLNPPHTHPRATEILTDPGGNSLGLIHFQFNVGKAKAVAIIALSDGTHGVITIANAVFGSTPTIRSDVLAKAFQVDKNIVDHLRKQFGMTTTRTKPSSPIQG
ncbi:GERMIN-LIKE PROTEIN SUBFAMILY 1 MEMBER 13-RELATED [Salix purpurea]|uniref:GERMIN-LIKE PROTEIN SUBFAMILY 1 MEMBER 13-RELATED n=1 Tax=Salix purpurea TaxID=77065 RepID=A0A9Q0WAJ0_SALPP|nr:GERMIN-LIKE PROTEIN SUBFAMILY 1 MEMBER 13-RELATED [Salix purpurea]